MRIFTLLLVLALQAGTPPDPKIKEEYQGLLKQLDLDNHPERHAQAAAWCVSKKWKAQADIHDLESRRYQFRKESEKLKAEPTAADLKRVAELAVKMRLEVESASARTSWLDAEIRERRAKLKDDDAAGLKAILAWAAKEEAGPRAASVAHELLKLEPGNDQAHLLLGHVKNGATWITPWDLLVEKGGIKDSIARAAIHKQLEALRPKKARVYPPNPLATCEKVQKGNFAPVLKDRIRAGDGRGIQYLFAPHNYSPAKSYPLILALHGGGNGGLAMSEEQAFSMIQDFIQAKDPVECVAVAPWARNHVGDSWKFRENALDAVDAVIDACERFNIDRRRIYLTGASMGGQGAQVISWTIPELFPGICPRSGYYLNDLYCPDLTGKHYLIFHGGKDTVVGQKTHQPFLEKIRKANANAELIFWPDEPHQLPNAKVSLMMMEFFNKRYALDYEPDLTLVRRMTEELLPWNKRPAEEAPRPPAMPAPAAAAPAPAGGTVVDLLELVNPTRDSVAGAWKLEGKALVTPPNDFSRLQVAAAVPAEYDLEVVAQRSGADKADTLVIGLVGGGSQFMVGLDGNNGTKSGLDAIDGKRFVENETTRDGAVFSADKPSTILCSVRKDRVTVSVDGKVVLDWKAEFPRLSLRTAWASRDPKALFLGGNKCVYHITKWVLRPAGTR